jgi:hypothetical protein
MSPAGRNPFTIDILRYALIGAQSNQKTRAKTPVGTPRPAESTHAILLEL